MTRKSLVMTCLLGLLLTCGTALAQNAGGGGNGGGGRRGGGGDPAQFRQRMMDRLKEQMGATDDEWKALEPRIQKVMEAQRDARTGGGGGRNGGGGRRGGGGGDSNGNADANANPSEVRKAQDSLRAAVDDGNTNPQELASRIKALRDAREKARANLQSAQKELKDLLTQKQEAVLLMFGMIE